jgi:hypothetical protein
VVLLALVHAALRLPSLGPAPPEDLSEDRWVSDALAGTALEALLLLGGAAVGYALGG